MSKTDLVLLHAPSVYDFRQESILYGPVSDLVPSTPVFEMYPIGLTTIAEYLERHGFRVRIVNLAVRMLDDPRFDAEAFIRKLNPRAFGIDLHWMPHCHGAIEVARLVKKHHPDTPVIFGGFSSSYFHDELLGEYPAIDFVVRGDSTEEPVLQLMRHIREWGTASGDAALAGVPNLTWRDGGGNVRANPITFSPENLDHVLVDYSYVLRAVARYRDLASFVPFKDWLDYPITAVLTCRGCTYNCRSCGGSCQAFYDIHHRTRPAYRRPEHLAQDLRHIARFSHGPVFILGDLRQPGPDYAPRFFEALGVFENPVIIEFFDAAPRDFLHKVAKHTPNFTIEISLESHSEEVRHAFGRPYGNAEIEDTMAYALEAGCKRLDIFFMIGLPRQDYQSVMDTIDYCEYLMKRFNGGDDKRLFPFISPLAPFMDPGSMVWNHPQAHGYRILFRSVEEHRQALVQPSWKHVMNYETQWMTRDEIVASTYEAGLRLNRLKTRYGLADASVAKATEQRIVKAIRLSKQIDDIMTIEDEGRRRRLLAALKPQVDGANLSTVCEKSELELPLKWLKLNIPRAAMVVLGSGWERLTGRLRPAADVESGVG